MHAHVKMPWGVDMKAVAAMAAVMMMVVCVSAQEKQQLGPGPYTETEQKVQRCLDLTSVASDACAIEGDILNPIYSRDARDLPTSDQIVRGITKMRAAALPSQSCCTGLAPYVNARCPCLPGYQQILPIGGFDPAYFEGATHIIALACRLDFPPCSTAPPAVAAAVGAAAGPNPTQPTQGAPAAG